MNNSQSRQKGGGGSPSKKQSSNQQQQQQQQQNQQPPDENKITPELLVDALSGHEDGLLSIAERLMTHYDSGYDAMGESIIDAFADVQKLFQHVVEAAHMEGAALERERGEGEWRRRMESLGMDVEGVLYGQIGDEEVGLDGGLNMSGVVGGSPSRGGGGGGDHSYGEDGNENEHGHNNNNNTTHHHLTPNKSEDHHRHEELIDQDVRDVLIDAIKKGQTHRDGRRFAECRTLYETSCVSASALLPVDSDHRGRLQLAVARAESMSADRACSILKYAMDDVLRSGLTLRQGRYPQMDVKERSDCVLERPNPLRSTPSRGYDVTTSWDQSKHYNSSAMMGSSGGGVGGGGAGGDATASSSMVEQSAEEALNSVIEEMKEILGAPVYNLTPLQNVSEKFWVALGEAKKSSARKEDRLEQALAKIKADFLLAREEYEEQLSEEREKVESLKRRFNDRRYSDNNGGGHHHHHHRRNSSPRDDGSALDEPYTPNRPRSATSRSSDSNNHHNGGMHYQFGGMDDTTTTNESHHSVSERNGGGRGGRNMSNQSVVSMGSEFAQKAKSLVHLLNCQGKEAMGGKGEPSTSTRGHRNDDLNYGRGMGGVPR